MAGAAATAFASSLAYASASRSPSLSASGNGPSGRSRSSSLSSLSSSASHPGPSRAASPSISGDTDDLMSDDDALGPHNNWGFDARQMERIRCEWGGGTCGAEFWEVEPLVEHVHVVHAFPDDPHHLGPQPGKKSAASYVCDWAGCARRGKTQGSKFALVAHLRSHTGEKPFHCPRPECDKSFTRTDALQKHMRVQHGDNIVAARKPPGAGGESGAPSKSKKKKGGRAAREASDDSAFGGGADDLPTAGGDEGEDGALQYAPDELAAMHAHPELSSEFVGYVVAKAKVAYLMAEHEGLAGELEALKAREAEMEMERDVLLKGIMRKEIGATASPADAAALERFLTSYSHEPASYPADFVCK
ncbi:hypothetical protein JCM10213_006858 [Rhodosporidiobolus nylandii]